MKSVLLFCLLPLLVFSQKDYTQYVDPFIGTGGHGHTFPGATVPFGMVQLSPDTRLHGWDGCSGYYYTDKRIYGFSHTHLSGTGASDYGDVLLMPTVGKIHLRRQQYSSPFQKQNENASPGYYSVFLDKPKVKVELTATTRTGLHKYTFPKSSAANVILDLTHRDHVKRGAITISGDREISGTRISSAWAANQVLYFVIQFSKPFKKFGIARANIRHKAARHKKGHHLKAYFQFDTRDGEAIYARVGISAVSVDGARKNLEVEQPDFDFEKVKADAQAAWNRELSKIDVESPDKSKLRTFYTALYHCLIAPNVYQDVDGSYRGRDMQVHQTKNFTYYTVFSLWDTYRALNPLLCLIDRKRTGDIVNTFLTEYEQGGLLPEWELSSNETFCMIGYHAVPIIADAYLKGIRSFNADTALQAMIHSSSLSKKELKTYRKPKNLLTSAMFYYYARGWDDYQKLGYVKQKSFSGSVSKTVEFAYDDWSIAQMAKQMGRNEVYEKYILRATNYRKLYDSTTGFLRPRKKNFVRHFNPYQLRRGYTEGNAWQYSFYAPQDMSGLMKLHGGKNHFAVFLDSLFHTTSKLPNKIHPDISGMIGQYVHGNEPSHQIAYEYDYAGQPWKTQAMVRRIMTEMYRDKPDGLAGNEDCGQMSAWYVFSALGFYPVCPGSNQYAIGSPWFDKATIHFENGKSFQIIATDNTAQSPYIHSATLNGTNDTKSYLLYKDLMNGGILQLQMSDTPNKDWGSNKGDVPQTQIAE